MPRVTVCLSVYNGAATLAKSLESVFAQTYRDFDVLVLDDGSTDGSAEIAGGFDCRLIVQQNAGRGAALKRMVEVADGELVALIDCDDQWLPEKLQMQVEQIDATGAALVHADCWFLYDDGGVVERNLDLAHASVAFDHILPDNRVIASSALFRRSEMLAAGNFAPDTLRCCDWYGWFVLAPGRLFAHLPEKLVRYSVLSTSLANAGYKFHEAQHYLLRDKIFPRADELFSGLRPEVARRYEHMLVERDGIALSSMARALEKSGDLRGAKSLHRRALSLAPAVPRVWTRALAGLFRLR